MDKEHKEILNHMSATLDEILVIQKKPKSMVMRIFEIGATAVTLLGILTVIDVIRNWIGG